MLVGGGLVTLAIALTHGLQLWQQIILAILFLALFAIATIAAYSATRLKKNGEGISAENEKKVSTENIEQKIRQWTDSFGLSRSIHTDDRFYFVIMVTLKPQQLPIMIRRHKDHPSYLELRSSLRTTDDQRELFDKMQKESQQSIRQTIDRECARSRIDYHSNEKLEFICIHKQIPITPDLTEAHFINNLNEMRFDVAVVGHTINGLFKPKPHGNDKMI